MSLSLVLLDRAIWSMQFLFLLLDRTMWLDTYVGLGKPLMYHRIVNDVDISHKEVIEDKHSTPGTGAPSFALITAERVLTLLIIGINLCSTG